MKWLPILIILTVAGPTSPQPDPFAVIVRKSEALEPLPFGAIRPQGWLETEIRSNLQGLTGHLDSLAPALILKDEIYGRDRLTKDIRHKDVGALAGGDTAAEVQYLWWNSETQGNWRDGFIRSAILMGDPQTLAKAKDWVHSILATQDPDGYLGIYDRDLRYRFDSENGELWSKTTLLRGLIAWYEYSHDATVLKAIERAVDNVIMNYPANRSHPFYSKTPYVGGLSHGLMFTDVLETLFRLTGRQLYLDYALFLYKDFSAATLHEDAQYNKIIDPAYHLQGHGVHTYEHLRAVAAAAFVSGNPALQKALAAYLQKIEAEITPSGAPAGDEWIGGRAGDATNTGYEFCSLEELMASYADLLGKTDSAAYGDKIEQLFFNAAQGARDPNTTCIAYLKTDNSYCMTGGLNGDTASARQTRYKYSPVHQDVAVCCAPNAGRIAPYFVDRMWMRSKTGLVATLLGPCRVTTNWKGTPLKITEKTTYPNDLSFDFEIDAAQAVNFTLAVRKPAWATGESINFSYTVKDGYFLITRNWLPGETLHIRLLTDVMTRKDHRNAAYFTYGPLVLARPITGIADTIRRYALPGFYDYHYRPDNLVVYSYQGEPVERSGKERFEVILFDSLHNSKAHVWLKPMGGTILRQVTFPVHDAATTYWLHRH